MLKKKSGSALERRLRAAHPPAPVVAGCPLTP